MWSSAFLEEDDVFEKSVEIEEEEGGLQYQFSNTGKGWFETHLGCSSSDFISKLQKMAIDNEEISIEVESIIEDITILKSLEIDATISSLSWAKDKGHIIKSLGITDNDLRNLRKFGDSRRVSLIQSCNLWENADNALKMLDEFQDVWGDEERNAWHNAMQQKTDAIKMWKTSLHQIDRITQKEKDILNKASELLASEGALTSRGLQERMMDSSFLQKSMTPSKLSKLLTMYGEEVDIISGSTRRTFVKMSDYGIIIKDPWSYAADFLDGDGFVTITERGEPRAGFIATGKRGKSHCEELHKSLDCGSLQLNQDVNGVSIHRLLFYEEDDVRKLLKGVLPHVKVKKEQIQEVLTFLDTDDLEKRETIKQSVRDANSTEGT
tara:strand:+ start:695 stop:1834 length:1140 start_codon:yes stop_codon:yes gene_type:complete